MNWCRYASPLGELLLAAQAGNITGLWLPEQKYYASTLAPDAAEDPSDAALRAVVRWLDRYFAGEKPAAAGLPLAPAGSPFRQKVWRALTEIPYGTVVTYGALAAELSRREGRAVSARAVGGAVGHNPISILIPCHRVVGADGSLTGYAGGLGKKRWLLDWEGAAMDALYTPKKGTAL